MSAAGVDGCPAGWAVATDDGALHVAKTLADVLALAPGVVGIDMPVGLTDAGPRLCDTLARRAIGARRASVFPTPVRAALSATTRAEASRLHRAADGRGLSAQAYGILPRIRDVDALLRADPDAAARVVEVHPEVSFAGMNGGAGLAHAKKTAEGRAERLTLLAPFFGDAPEHAGCGIPRSALALDDVLDAFAALWSARRVASGAARRLPEPPPLDAHGLAMAIHV